ncbi:Glycosyl hydrolase family 99 [Plasmodiophora brassicae]|uniref:Uncharacterized protein n=2 Tax=Plasmodiophora brassicae TaxID=37360 RepID=A0A3P3YI50_PLABS|nr:unnamed protein product [Plasmodiophora brassicae]
MAPCRLPLLCLCLAALLARPGRPAVSDDDAVYAFFYSWYGNPDVDGEWRHWNHTVLQHWDPGVARAWPPPTAFEPPGDAGATFHPSRGWYSSRDDAVLDDQMRDLVRSNVRVVVASWWGRPDVPDAMDGQGVRTDDAVRHLVDAGRRAGLRVAFHSEPYPSRTVDSVRRDIDYLHEQYKDGSDARRMTIFVYDSYQIAEGDWARLLRPGGDLSIRGTRVDADVIGLAVDRHHLRELRDAGFDGVYTYFASDGATYGSTWSNWADIRRFTEAHGLAFVACVAPGYDDTRIRPWNGAATRPRQNGRYYERSWHAAMAARPDAIAVTSYNEFGEGTQIEPCSPFTTTSGAALLDYSPGDPDLYLRLTAAFAAEYVAQRQQARAEL